MMPSIFPYFIKKIYYSQRYEMYRIVTLTQILHAILFCNFRFTKQIIKSILLLLVLTL